MNIDFTYRTRIHTELIVWYIRFIAIEFSNLNFSYTLDLRCATDFYGSSCDKLCIPRNDASGHYVCQQGTGNKVCLEGTELNSL